MTFLAIAAGYHGLRKMAQAFSRYFSPLAQAGDWVAGDGQSLRSTVQDAHTTRQSVASVGSLYCQRTATTRSPPNLSPKPSLRTRCSTSAPSSSWESW